MYFQTGAALTKHCKSKSCRALVLLVVLVSVFCFFDAVLECFHFLLTFRMLFVLFEAVLDVFCFFEAVLQFLDFV